MSLLRLAAWGIGGWLVGLALRALGLSLVINVAVVLLCAWYLVIAIRVLIATIRLDLLLRRKPYLRYLLALQREFGKESTRG